MKLKLIIGLLFIVTEFFTQNIATDRKLHNKYWNMRSRLRNDFMKVGSGPGESIPMQQRGFLYYPNDNPYGEFVFPNAESGEKAKWGDAMGDLGYYIGVLATEYALLQLNSQSPDTVIKELYYALGALNRMDLQAEINFESAWGTSYPSSLDGFMLRDDVAGENFITDNLSHFNYYGNKGFKSKIFINELDGSGGGPDSKDKTIVPRYFKWDHNHNFPPKGYYRKYEGAYLSQDNWINVLVGLALVRRFVPPEVSYGGNNIHGGDPGSFSDAAYAIGHRVYNYMKDGYGNSFAWNLQYPNGDDIGSDWGGIAYLTSYPMAEALNKMENFDWGYKTYGATNHFNNECDWNDWVTGGNKAQNWYRKNISSPIEQAAYNVYPHFSGSHLHPSLVYENLFIAQLGSFWLSADVPIMSTNLAGISNCVYEYKGNKTKHNQSIRINSDGIFHGDLLRMAIHGWGNCFDNAFVTSSFDNSYSLLDAAPCEGPFNWNSNDVNVGIKGPIANGEWSTTSRLDHLDRRNSNHNFLGEYNGLDYMLYHNLFYLVAQQANPGYLGWRMVDLTSRDLKIDYPTTVNGNPWGSVANPAFVPSHEYIVATNKLNSGADATFQAGKVIYFKPGFTASAGSKLHAYIKNDENFCANNADFTNPFDLSVNARTFSQTDSSKAFSNHPTSYVKSEVMDENKIAELREAKKKETLEIVLKNVKKITTRSSVTKVYPNPSTGTFSIFIDEPSNYESVYITNSLSQTVYEMKNMNSVTSVDLTGQSKGIYFVMFRLKDNSMNTVKIIIN